MTRFQSTLTVTTARTLAAIGIDRDATRSKISDLTAEQETIARRAFGRDFTAGESERMGRLVDGTENARARLAAFDDEARAVILEIARDPRNLEGPVVAEGSKMLNDGPLGQLRSEASRTIDNAFRAGSLPDYAAERATALLSAGSPYEQDLSARWANAAGDPAYLSAFAKLVRDPVRGHMLFDPKELDAYRAVEGLRAGLTIGGGTGGYLIPLSLDPAVMLTNAGSTNAMRQVCRVVQTVTNTWQGVTSAGVVAEWLATEATQVAEATPTLAPLSIPVILGDAYLHASFQVSMDALDFVPSMQKILLDAADRLMATAYTTGAGTTEPKGLVTALVGGSSEINTKGSEAIAATDPFDLQAALPARFSPNAVFMAHLAIINGYSIMETTNGGRFFPEIGSGRLLNRRLIENSDMDGVIVPAATANNYVLAYFDPNEFIIADRVGATLELLPNVMGANGRPTGERGYLLWFRTGSDLSSIAAGRLLDVPTTA